jgi:hypothetical protein
MLYPTTASYAKKHYPAPYAEALAALRSSSSKAKAAPWKTLSFQWSMAVRIDSADILNGSELIATMLGKSKAKKRDFAPIDEALRETDPQSYCDQHVASGQFCIALSCQGQYQSAALPASDSCPAEIVEAHRVAPACPAASGAALLHIHYPSAKAPGIHQHEITGGYVKDGSCILMDSERILRELDPASGTVIFAGMLQRTAQASFDACAEGSTFRYRNKPLTKMTQAEILAAIHARKVWPNGCIAGIHFTIPTPPALTGSEPVYPPGSMMRPAATALGSASSMGLVAPALSPQSKTKKPTV